jgi:putative effector of murein hydrolase
MRGFFTNKLAWLFASLHALFFGIALYQRFGIFHLYYEPLLLKILLIVDIFWVLIADNFGMNSLDRPLNWLLFTLAGGCLEWFVIGYGVAQLSSSKAKTVSTDVE